MVKLTTIQLWRPRPSLLLEYIVYVCRPSWPAKFTNIIIVVNFVCFKLQSEEDVKFDILAAAWKKTHEK